MRKPGVSAGRTQIYALGESGILIRLLEAGYPGKYGQITGRWRRLENFHGRQYEGQNYRLVPMQLIGPSVVRDLLERAVRDGPQAA